ncbi:hypothetical protein N7528_009416 [Penicillium herquei]|nr:hypothetical protein N7528_009416 [Penicillium herquei]
MTRHFKDEHEHIHEPEILSIDKADIQYSFDNLDGLLEMRDQQGNVISMIASIGARLSQSARSVRKASSAFTDDIVQELAISNLVTCSSIANCRLRMTTNLSTIS